MGTETRSCWQAAGAIGLKLYDHVFYRPGFTVEMDREFDLVVVDLVEAVRPLWKGPSAFPGDPYVHDEFREWYSDQSPAMSGLPVPGEHGDSGRHWPPISTCSTP